MLNRTDLDKFKTWIFDCDGVLLNTNEIKTNVFHEVALPYGKVNAAKFVNYHMQNAGISRFTKLKFFLTQIVGKEFDQQEYSSLLDMINSRLKEKLANCSKTKGLDSFLAKIQPEVKKFVVSGSEEQELRTTLQQFGLANKFTGVYGSPLTKDVIIKNLLDSNQINKPVIYVGDGRFDFEMAELFAFDFIFMTEHTEFLDWQNFFNNKNEVKIIKNFTEL